MNRIVIFAAATLLLSACNKPAPADASESAAVPAATAEQAPPSTRPVAPVTAPPVDAATAPATQADQAVDDAIDKVLGDHVRYRAAILQFQQAVTAGDAEAVAAMVEYPLTATIDGKKMSIKDPKTFIAQYESIVTPEIAAAITGQDYSALMVNARGVMFGNGQAWLNGICKDSACRTFDVKVVAIQPGA